MSATQPARKFEHCCVCRRPIVREDDDAGLCISCGGYNRRVHGLGSSMQGVSRLGWTILFLLEVVAPAAVLILMTVLYWSKA